MSPRSRWEHRHRLYQDQNKACYYCGRKVGLSSWTLDHVIPKCKGGVGSKDNLVGACKSCNWLKSGLRPEVFYYQIRKVFEHTVDELVRK